jgi:signal transduction histidine kinase
VSSFSAVRPHPLVPRRWAGTHVDAWLAGTLAVASVGYLLALPAGGPYRPLTAGAFLLAVVGPLALLWRQTAPLATQAGTSSVVILNSAAGFPIGFLDWPAWIALFTCFDVGGRRVRTVAVVIAAMGIAGYVAFAPGPTSAQLPGIVVHFLVATIVGDLSSRRARAAAAEAHRAAESREHALRAERLLLQERGRLARELHDSLGHTVNVMVLQAGVGRRVFTENPTYAQEALSSIETSGRGALDELSRLLRVLQPDESEEVAQPVAPTVTDLEQLVGRIRAAGRQVELRALVSELPPSSARAVYRIVQEALTNAVKHTDTGTIRVEVEQTGTAVRLEVTNECTPSDDGRPGHGLVNMRERARLEGGELEAGPVDGGFRVRAVLPMEAAVSP